MKHYKNFSELLKDISKGRPLYRIASDLNVSDVTLYKVEKGLYDSNVTATTAANLCRVFNLDPSELKYFDFKPPEAFIDDVTNRLNINALEEEYSYEHTKNKLIGHFKDNSYSLTMDTPLCFIQFDSNIKNTILVWEAKKGKDYVLIFELPTKKIYSNKYKNYSDDNIRDFSNLFLLLNTKKGIETYFSFENDAEKMFSMPIDAKKASHRFRNCKNYVFFTHSKEIYKLIKKYDFDFESKKNIQLIYCLYKDKTVTKILIGKEIIEIK